MNIRYNQVDGETEKILNEYFDFKECMVEIQPGSILVPLKYQHLIDDILNMDIRADDVWLISYPRTGSTWAREMAWCIDNDLNFDGAKVVAQDRFPLLEYTILYSNTLAHWKNRFSNSVDAVKEMKSPRYIKTHLPWELLPYQIQSGIVKPKIIYTARDPKDVVLSYYHFLKLLNRFHGSFETFCDIFSRGKVPRGSIWDHVPPFWSRRNEPNILFLKYEESKKDTRKTVQDCAEFFGKSIADVDALLDHLSLNNMKKNPAINMEILKTDQECTTGKSDPENHFIRNGRMGDWKNLLNETMVETFTKKNREHFEKIGLFFE